MKKVLTVLLSLLVVAGAAGAKVSGKIVDSTMVWNGITRYYEVYLPPNLPANPSMVLMLHGTNFAVPPTPLSTLMWGWQNVANQYGFILVKPASTYNSKIGAVELGRVLHGFGISRAAGRFRLSAPTDY